MESTPPTADADPLAQPTRARLLDLVDELGGSATSEDLAARLRRHRSGIRVHLERLEVAGLVERRRVPQARGRPRDLWSITPAARRARRRPDASAELAGWLAESIPARPGRLREVEAAGRRLGQRLSEGDAELPLEDRFEQLLAALGFEPQARAVGADGVCFELGNCPYRSAVHANQPVVCTLHRGLTRGVLDRLAPHSVLRSFVPKDPDRAGCLIEIGSETQPPDAGEPS